MIIRLYTPEDKDALIGLLRLNTPQYFDKSEERDFVEYLEEQVEDYFVVEENKQIIGSGGINYMTEAKLARISWDIIHPDFQGKGIGKKLTLHRIDQIKRNPAINLVMVRTTQIVYKFYQQLGFELEKTEKNYWAEGFDLYQMQLDLTKPLHQ
jgi:ribosomal protein S18 acetylase RimI-like enzyme